MQGSNSYVNHVRYFGTQVLNAGSTKIFNRLLIMTETPESNGGPVKAYKNLDFLQSPEARSIRVQCELTEPLHRLRRNGVHNTIVFFGSARTKPEAEAETAADKLSGPYYDAARELAKVMTEWSMQIVEPKQRYYVCSGGGPGIMEASNRGAMDVGGKNVGLGISLPFEQSNNPYITDELDFEFHYFFVRKYWFTYLAKALVAFPGGFGTMDELFENLTLIQTQKINKKIPIVLFGADFWSDIVNFDNFVKWGVISARDLELFKVIDTVPDAHRYLVTEINKLHVQYHNDGSTLPGPIM